MIKEGVIHIQDRESTNGWDPVQGENLTQLMRSNKKLTRVEQDQLLSDTLSIMKQCVNPAAPNKQTNTGLIIGYVQSGKTLSFTSLAALASDNNYGLIVLLAGTTNNLVEQSIDRMKSDLGLEKNRNWKLFSTQEKGFGSEQAERVKEELLKRRRDSPRTRTIIIIAMKEHSHLANLANRLKNINLVGIPTLIIDDEGDKAGMNTKALQDEMSTIHEQIIILRQCFPLHSYLLYTATPQAPLLISRIDTLSPDFGFVLTPGSEYIGGKEFFIDGSDKFIELIPCTDTRNSDEKPPQKPPKSLIRALMDFLVGVAIGMLNGEDNKGNNRSMMIHPAVAKDDHRIFHRWVSNTMDDWKGILKEKNSQSHKELINEFCTAYSRLTKTYKTKYSFQEIEPWIFEAVTGTLIQEINTRERDKIPSIDWKGDYSWILIGGIGLDRGFTVEGLTVSYMPRSTGTGISDSIQQRARFFGYKKTYLGLCRIYLTKDNKEAFEDYVSHEENIRTSISQHIKEGSGLKGWRRTFILSKSLRPTRNSVIMLDFDKFRGRRNWIIPDYPYKDEDLVANNRSVVTQLLNSLEFQELKEDGWTEQQTIPAFNDDLQLSEIIRFIRLLTYSNMKDTNQHLTLLLELEMLQDHSPDMRCSVYAFSGPWSQCDSRRSVTETGKIGNLFQGENVNTNYPGARKLYSAKNVTFHIHRYHIENSDKSMIIAEDVPVLAVRIPKELNKDLWIEIDNNDSI